MEQTEPTQLKTYIQVLCTGIIDGLGERERERESVCVCFPGVLSPAGDFSCTRSFCRTSGRLVSQRRMTLDIGCAATVIKWYSSP